MRRILLHSCCAVCACGCIESLKEDGWDVVFFYDNPNIFPEAERTKRLDNVRMLSESFGIKLVVGKTPHEDWACIIKGLEGEREGGKRCEMCFSMNLKLAKAAAEGEGISAFCTSLTVSRHKNSKIVISAGIGFSGFEPYDFKKKGGEMRSIKIAKEMGIYRQNYCGCEYSIRNAMPEVSPLLA